MKYGKIMILGTILASCIPAAFADTVLYGDISTSGTATITTASITFAGSTIVKTPTSPDSPFFDQSTGAVIGQGDQNFSNFDSSAQMHYVTGATSSTVNRNNNFTSRSAAAFTFPTPSNLGNPFTPVLFYQVIEGGNTLNLYLTEVDSVVLGVTQVTTGTGKNKKITVPGVAGSFTGEGYVTENGIDQSFGTFSLTNNGTGAGKETFSMQFIVPTPEPSSFALLGTGFLGLVGVARRKFFNA